MIDESNTAPFFCAWYVKEKNVLFVHQLCREIWFFQMLFPFSLMGFLLEPLYLRLLSTQKVITVSGSTKNDLCRFGFKEKNIQIISEGVECEVLPSSPSVQKFIRPTILALGSIRPMKRTLHIVKAFELVKQQMPMIQLLVAGKAEGWYGKKVLNAIATSSASESITYLGKISLETKKELLQKAHLLCVTSVKEGWGLVVTEANSQGTPAVVYNVDGLRDSVVHAKTGWVSSHNTPAALAQAIFNAFENNEHYKNIQSSAYEWSKTITFEKSFEDFSQILSGITENH